MRETARRWVAAPAGAALLAVAALPAAAVAQEAGVPGAAPQAEQPEVAYTLGGLSVEGDGPDEVMFGVGAFNVIPNDDARDGVSNHDALAEGRLEYRFGDTAFGVGPLFGLMANHEGGLFGYGAVYSDVRYQRWTFTPSFGVGGYHQGGGKDLGGTFQFHLALDVGYSFEDGNRLGVKMAHISNAGIHDDNPGEESLLLTYTVPLTGF